jgi:hypothetical protein
MPRGGGCKQIENLLNLMGQFACKNLCEFFPRTNISEGIKDGLLGQPGPDARSVLVVGAWLGKRRPPGPGPKELV